ncbi:unnamed protein product, partial [Cylicostephanus goldi]
MWCDVDGLWGGRVGVVGWWQGDSRWVVVEWSR